MSEAAAVAPVPPAPPAHPAHHAARRSWLFWTTALVILALDLWTKQAVFARLGVDPKQFASIEEFRRAPAPPKLWILGTSLDSKDRIGLVATFNPGMMWGAFDDHPTLLKLVRPLAVLVIFMLLSSLPAGQWSSRLALGGILGGALGNIHDSFRFIGVRDFFEVYLRDVWLCTPFPAFNLADSAICVGVAVLALGMMRGTHEPAAAAKPPLAA